MAKKIYTEEEARERKNARQREYAERTGYRAGAEYNKLHSKTVTIRLFIPKDNDILEHIEKQPQKSEYFRQLVRKDIENSIDEQ